jgi:hypothetical protein
MATNTETPTTLVPGTATGDQLGAGAAGGTDYNTGETGAINPSGPPNAGQRGGETALLITMEEQDGSTASVVFDAGDYPPSARKGIGSKTVSLAANDFQSIILDAGRYVQSDGTITFTITGGVRVKVFALPTGY